MLGKYMNTTVRLSCLVLLMLSSHRCAAADEDFDDSLKAFLHDNFDGKRCGMVIGIVDQHEAKVFGAGTLDNGTAEEVNGDTVFEIGSITKTFTTLLLQDAIHRCEMGLDDPVETYLPKGVTMPTRNGKSITLLHLATHTSGLPRNPQNLTATRAENPFADYTVDKLYDFLSEHALRRDPGAAFEYSNAGMALLGQALVATAGKDYESLVVQRICRPLGMDSTGI